MHCQHCFTESSDRSPHCMQCGRPFFEAKAPATAQSIEKKPNSGLFGLAAGLAVGLYSGIYLLLLLLPTLLIRWVAGKFLKPAAQPYLLSIATQAGQTLLLFTFVLILPLSASTLVQFDLFVLVDVVLPAVGLIWLIAKPGKWPIAALTIFQIFALLQNAFNFSEMVVGTQNHKALVVHMIWRICAIFFMWQSYLRLRGVNVVAPPSSNPVVDVRP
jgi:hypothetical protein